MGYEPEKTPGVGGTYPNAEIRFQAVGDHAPAAICGQDA